MTEEQVGFVSEMVKRSEGWTVVAKWASDRRRTLVKNLVHEDNPEVRGAIKEIDAFLNKVNSCVKK